MPGDALKFSPAGTRGGLPAALAELTPRTRALVQAAAAAGATAGAAAAAPVAAPDAVVALTATALGASPQYFTCAARALDWAVQGGAAPARGAAPRVAFRVGDPAFKAVALVGAAEVRLKVGVKKQHGEPRCHFRARELVAAARAAF